MSKIAQYEASQYIWHLGRSCDDVDQYRSNIADILARLSIEDIDFVAEKQKLHDNIYDIKREM